MSQAKPTQTLEEMARSLIGCAAYDIRDAFAKDLESYARAYANQRLREAAEVLRSERRFVSAGVLTAMIEGEP